MLVQGVAFITMYIETMPVGQLCAEILGILERGARAMVFLGADHTMQLHAIRRRRLISGRQFCTGVFLGLVVDGPLRTGRCYVRRLPPDTCVSVSTLR